MPITAGYPALAEDVNAALAARLQLAGGAMTGALSLSGNATSALNAVPLQQLNSTASGLLPLSGGTMTGPLYYTATGGTVVRAAQDRWADYVNVKDFGAVGNQSTDDTAAVQAALNTGKNVYMPAGAY